MSTIAMNVGDIVETDRGCYELVGVIGSGGMGVVWEALDLQLGGYVAIKFMLDARGESCHRFRREGQVLQRLAHPNIVQFIDVGQTERQEPFLVIERLSGQTLREKLLAFGRLAPREALKIAHAVAGALKAAHELGVVHRDLKPSNVFIQDEPSTGRRASAVKLIDFGIAKDTWIQTYTGRGTLLGSLQYMSPEQISANCSVDHRSDLWSLGALMYEMIQGEALFVASASLVLHAVLNNPIDPIPWRRIIVPTKIEAIIRRCLQRDPNERISSAEELEKELGRLLHASDDELEIICVQTDCQNEKTLDLHRGGNWLANPASDAVAITIRKEFEEIERRTGERHRQLIRMHVIAISGLGLILALIAILAWYRVPLPWKEQTQAQSDPSASSLKPPDFVDKVNSAPAVASAYPSRRYISGCRY